MSVTAPQTPQISAASLSITRPALLYTHTRSDFSLTCPKSTQVSRTVAFEKSGCATPGAEEHRLLIACLIFPPGIVSHVTCWNQVLTTAPVFLRLLYQSHVLKSSHASSKRLSQQTFHRPKDMSFEKEFTISKFFHGPLSRAPGYNLATNAGLKWVCTLPLLSASPLLTCLSLRTTRVTLRTALTPFQQTTGQEVFSINAHRARTHSPPKQRSKERLVPPFPTANGLASLVSTKRKISCFHQG